MPPAVPGYPCEVVERVFLEIGIRLLQTFPDGQKRWGNEPPSTPYKGKSLMTQGAGRGPGFGTTAGCYDIAQICAVLSKLTPDKNAGEVLEHIKQVALEESEKE